MTLRSRGFAFITFADPRNAEDACVGMQGYELQNRRLRVDKSAPKGQRAARQANERANYDNRGTSQSYNGSGYERDRGGSGGSYERVDRGYDRGYDRSGYPSGGSNGGGDRGVYDRGDRSGYGGGGDRGPRGSYDRGYSGGPSQGGGMYDRGSSGGGYGGDRYDRGDRSSYTPADRGNYGYSDRGSDRGGGGGGSSGGYSGYDIPDRGYSHNDRSSGYNRGPGAPGGSKGVCFQWQKGDCRFGSNCRYSHDGPPGGGLPQNSIPRGGYDSYDAPR